MGLSFSLTSASPARAVIPVTKSDTDELPDGPCRALLVGTAGTATIKDGTGVTRTAVPLQQGYNPISVAQVFDAGTADDIWALY